MNRLLMLTTASPTKTDFYLENYPHDQAKTFIANLTALSHVLFIDCRVPTQSHVITIVVHDAMIGQIISIFAIKLSLLLLCLNINLSFHDLSANCGLHSSNRRHCNDSIKKIIERTVGQRNTNW